MRFIIIGYNLLHNEFGLYNINTGFNEGSLIIPLISFVYLLVVDSLELYAISFFILDYFFFHKYFLSQTKKIIKSFIIIY